MHSEPRAPAVQSNIWYADSVCGHPESNGQDGAPKVIVRKVAQNRSPNPCTVALRTAQCTQCVVARRTCLSPPVSAREAIYAQPVYLIPLYPDNPSLAQALPKSRPKLPKPGPGPGSGPGPGPRSGSGPGPGTQFQVQVRLRVQAKLPPSGQSYPGSGPSYPVLD